MKKATKLVLTSVLTIAMCVSLIAGATFALFTGGDSVNITVSSGKVDVEANVSGLYYASDATGAEYDWQPAAKTVEDDVTTLTGTFANGGTATYSTTTNELKLDLITPGDAVKVTIAIANSSSVAIKYQTRVMITDTTEGDHDHSLDEVLEATLDDVKLAKAGEILATDWTPVAANDTLEDTTHELVIDLPWTVDNDYQELSCLIEVTVYAVQGNAKVSDVIVASSEGLKDAITNAEDGATISIAKDITEVGSITVDKDLTITSDGNEMSELSNIRITVTNKASLTLEKLEVTENSYVNVTNASSITVENCYVNVNPEKCGNNSRNAFIASTSETNNPPLLLNIVGNTFIIQHTNGDAYSTAIFSWSYVADGSVIANNTFGSETSRCTFAAVKLMDFDDGATIEIKDNVVYSTYGFAAFDLYQNNSRDNTYTAILDGNTVYATNDAKFLWIEASGTSSNKPGHGQAIVLDTNKYYVDGVETPIDKDAYDSDTFTKGLPGYQFSFVSWNVVLDENGKILSGTFILCGSFSEEDFNALVSSDANSEDIIISYVAL